MIISSKNIFVYKTTANIILNGGIAIIPTDTVYGFAVNAFNLKSQKQVYIIKKRHYGKPLILMTYNIRMAEIFVNISATALKLATKFWPGQLTLILPTTKLGKILSGGRDNLGLRIPNNSFILTLLKEIKVPIFTTSVNISNEQSAKCISEVLKFRKYVDVIIDGGKCKFSNESTIIDAVHFPYIIVRKGCLPVTNILNCIS
ncbi:MAG: threonylcarbamoyl-AMP synthase [Endomicrobium sp.]|jgi:L-threonylcarbamoyladenylate synthase|nr:threonylcarbamoyl-AMP synthase [Endomicrobium sp.]